jgi:hypothetical protein
MSLFSVHNATDGSFHLYLEEPDANLDLIEDVVANVPMFFLAQMRDHSGIESMGSLEQARLLDKVRAKVPPFVTCLAKITEQEALDLAEALIMNVKFARAVAGKTTKLELVK